MAGAGLMLIWIVFAGRDWWLLNTLDPGILLHVGYVRLAGNCCGYGPAVMVDEWGPRAFDERRSVRLLCVVIHQLLVRPIGVEDVALVGRSSRKLSRIFSYRFPDIHRSDFVQSRQQWLVGLCVVTFRLAIYLWLRSNVSTPGFHWVSWLSRGNTVSLMYLAGIVVCIQFELAARREFVFRRTLRAAKARVDAASRVIKHQNERMREVVREKERFFSSAYHDIQQPLAAINLIHPQRADKTRR